MWVGFFYSVSKKNKGGENDEQETLDVAEA